MLQAGDPAPDFTMEADKGGSVSLKDLRGKTVVLYFYPKDDTPGMHAGILRLPGSLPDVSEPGGPDLRRQLRRYSFPREVRGEVRPALPASERPGHLRIHGVRRVQGEDELRPEVHGDRAIDLRHRRRRPDRQGLPQREGGRSRRKGAGRSVRVKGAVRGVPGAIRGVPVRTDVAGGAAACTAEATACTVSGAPARGRNPLLPVPTNQSTARPRARCSGCRRNRNPRAVSR